MKKILASLLLALTVTNIEATLSTPVASAVAASDWTAGRIIEDNLFTSSGDMTVDQIQSFLNARNPSCDTNGTKPATEYGRPDLTHAQYAQARGWAGPPYICLKDYYEVPKYTAGNYIPANNFSGSIPAGAVSAAQIIYDAAKLNNINPKVILIKIATESAGPLTSDTWPTQNQYTYAMGSHCPDSGPNGTANCDRNYAGFSMQVSSGVGLLRWYLDNMQQSWWSYKRPYQTNSVLWSLAGSGCGAGDVYIQTKATAALYTYTPYQPNQAALNDMYGQGDGCSQHGNRNFWRVWNDWFGNPAPKRDFQLMKSSTSSQQYVVYNRMKQAIPSGDVITAWGLDRIPLEVVDQSTIDGFSNGPDLDVIFRINNGSELYLADNGNRYYIGSPDMLKTWKLDAKVISGVPTGLGNLPTNAGNLGYVAKSQSGTDIYMLDGLNANNATILRRYSDPGTLRAIEGENPTVVTVSDWRFNSLNGSVQSDVNSTKMSYGGNEYQLVSGQKLSQPYSIATLYPGSAFQASQITFNRFATTSAATPLIRADGNPAVYLVQNGQKHHVMSSSVLSGWTGTSYKVNVVNTSYANTIPTNPTDAASTIAAVGATSSAYVMEGGVARPVKSTLSPVYTTNTSFPASQNLINAYMAGKAIDSRFVHNTKTNALVMLDTNGTYYPIPSVPVAELWGVNSTNTLDLPDDILNTYTAGKALSAIVTDGATTAAIVNGTKRTMDDVKSWGTPGALVVSSDLFASLPQGSSLAPLSKNGNIYTRMINGIPYITSDTNIAHVWGIADSAPDLSRLINTSFPAPHMLTPVLQSSGSYYVPNNQQFIQMSPALYANLGWNYPVMSDFQPTSVPFASAQWTKPLITADTTTWYVMDGGTLRYFPNKVVQDYWLQGYTQEFAASRDLISLFKKSTNIERAVKSQSSSKIFAAEAATKRWILSPSTFSTQYAPFTIVSDKLLSTLPDGNVIP